MMESVKEVKKLRKHNAEELEIIYVQLSKSKTPIAFARKVKELLDQSNYETVEDAERFVLNTTFEMELYYSIDGGLFMVESEAVESEIPMFNPYTGDKLDEVNV